MTERLIILFFLAFMFASGCSEEAKKGSPSTAPAMNQSPDEHISGDATSADHVSGASSSDSHMSGN
jgi:hypothetical protein